MFVLVVLGIFSLTSVYWLFALIFLKTVFCINTVYHTIMYMLTSAFQMKNNGTCNKRGEK